MPGETELERRVPRPTSEGAFAQRDGHGLSSPQDPHPGPSYYDVSLLAAPVWKWEIATYFFFGGLSGGAYILSRLAERFGGEQYRDLSRMASVVALLGLAPCPPLLIKDLGDPKRFHHMLRVFKPETPMNLGTWTMTAYSGAAALTVLREWLRGDASEEERSAWAKVTDPLVLAVTDVGGLPLALMMTTYTGVLISCTSTPIWCKNPWLAPLFSASGMASGAAAINLALGATGVPPESPSRKALDRIDTFAHFAEGMALAAYLASLGGLSKPLTQGKMAPHTWAGAMGIVASEVLKHLPVRGRLGKLAKFTSSVIGLAGAYSLRWAIIHAGHLSADDPDAARAISRKSVRERLERQTEANRPA